MLAFDSGGCILPAEEKKKEDERLFEEEYAKLKGKTEKKYALIPKFYSKVRCSVNGNRPRVLHQTPQVVCISIYISIHIPFAPYM